MFENLNDASKNAAKQLAGYITHLQVIWNFFNLFLVFTLYWELCWIYLFLKHVQCWIYKHFPSVGSAIVVDDYDERKACVCRWKSGKALLVSTYWKCLDRLTSDVVCWISYCDHRAFKEFKVISLFSRHIEWGPSIVIHWPKTYRISMCKPFLHTMIDGFSFLNTLHQCVRYE